MTDFYDLYLRSKRGESEEYPLTKGRCLEICGHCYEMEDTVVCTNPPIFHRVCKHCGHRQEGRSHDYWQDDE